MEKPSRRRLLEGIIHEQPEKDETCSNCASESSRRSVYSKLSGNKNDVNPRVDIIVDTEAPYAHNNLKRLLNKFDEESSALDICVNKWSQWDNFRHRDNPVQPKAVYYPGCFRVFLDRKLIASYSPERAKKNREKEMSASPEPRSHQEYIDSKIRESCE